MVLRDWCAGLKNYEENNQFFQVSHPKEVRNMLRASDIIEGVQNFVVNWARVKKGENIIEFTPDEAGDMTFSCWMGMVGGKFTVIE